VTTTSFAIILCGQCCRLLVGHRGYRLRLRKKLLCFAL